MVVERGIEVTSAAMGNSTRLEILERLSEGEASVGELVERFEMTQQAVSKHISVLKEAGLVRQHQVGRTRMCQLVPCTLEDAHRWLSAHRAVWNQRFVGLERNLEAARSDG